MEARIQSGKEFWGEKGANSIPFVTRVVDWHSKAVLLYKLNVDFFLYLVGEEQICIKWYREHLYHIGTDYRTLRSDQWYKRLPSLCRS